MSDWKVLLKQIRHNNEYLPLLTHNTPLPTAWHICPVHILLQHRMYNTLCINPEMEHETMRMGITPYPLTTSMFYNLRTHRMRCLLYMSQYMKLHAAQTNARSIKLLTSTATPSISTFPAIANVGIILYTSLQFHEHLEMLDLEFATAGLNLTSVLKHTGTYSLVISKCYGF